MTKQLQQQQGKISITVNKMSVVGVDLGYQNSVIAAAGRGGVDVLMNGSAKRLNPYV